MMNQAWTLVIGWVTVSGLVGFALMGFDKARARDGSWRIPEKTFFTLSLVGGCFGILLGSSAFRHKTRKATFMGVVIILAVFWVVILFELQQLIGSPF